MTNELQFTVPGHPVGKGRAKAARRGKFITMYTPEKTANYEGLIAHAAHIAMNGNPMFTKPCAVELDVRLQIPDSWSSKKKKMASEEMIGATKKPDLDNVLKAILDGMNGVVFKDDVQVVRISQQKRYAETPGVVVIVRELDMVTA